MCRKLESQVESGFHNTPLLRTIQDPLSISVLPALQHTYNSSNDLPLDSTRERHILTMPHSKSVQTEETGGTHLNHSWPPKVMSSMIPKSCIVQHHSKVQVQSLIQDCELDKIKVKLHSSKIKLDRDRANTSIPKGRRGQDERTNEPKARVILLGAKAQSWASCAHGSNQWAFQPSWKAQPQCFAGCYPHAYCLQPSIGGGSCY